MSTQSLKWAAIISFFVSMVVLVGGGMFAIKDLPPYPGKVVGPDGKLLFQKSDIIAGQDLYQRYGLMDHGSVWGHGSQRGPEFSATSVHLVSLSVRDLLAEEQYKKPYEELGDLEKGLVDLKKIQEIKTNRYDASKDTLTLTPSQAKALDEILQHWEKTFKEGEKRYGLLPSTIPTELERRQISRFFFWTAWVASTKRPGQDYTYTNNWPADRSVGNLATTGTYLWTIGGILGLPIVLGIFVFCVHYFGLWYGATKGIPLAENSLTCRSRRASSGLQSIFSWSFSFSWCRRPLEGS